MSSRESQRGGIYLPMIVYHEDFHPGMANYEPCKHARRLEDGSFVIPRVVESFTMDGMDSSFVCLDCANELA